MLFRSRLHRCASGMVGCECPLAETDEGGHVCLITGLCISEVRTSCLEYIDHAVFEPSTGPRQPEDDDIYDRVFCVVNNFLLSSRTASCRQMEQKKFLQKRQAAFWRVLKQRKRDNPYILPDICSVVAEVAHSDPPPPSLISRLSGVPQHDPKLIVRHSSCTVAHGILQIYKMGFRKMYQGGKFDSMVIGMLYMTRSGLSTRGVFNLPATPHIHELLPSETYLNCLGVSNKVICDTENEIKSCIRALCDSRASKAAKADFALNLRPKPKSKDSKPSPSPASKSVTHQKEESRHKGRPGDKTCLSVNFKPVCKINLKSSKALVTGTSSKLNYRPNSQPLLSRPTPVCVASAQ